MPGGHQDLSARSPNPRQTRCCRPTSPPGPHSGPSLRTPCRTVLRRLCSCQASAGNPLLFLARLENESFESQLGYQLPQEASLHLRWVSQGVSLSTGRVLLNCVCVSPFRIIHTFAMLSCPLEAQIVKIPFNWAQSLEVRSSVLAWLSPQSF